MNWLRASAPGGRVLSQLEFARQAADLLHVIHEKVGIIHLDLRLDNFVITQQGVGFVDFGSAVRVGENIQGNPLLATIFEELMRTSQIQRMLEKMTLNGAVTSPILNDAYGKVDKAVDLFYLAVQINSPLSNPDFRGLISFDPDSEEATALAHVTNEVLKPADPSNPHIKTAQDLLHAIRGINLAVPPAPLAASGAR
jgi:serine/threonine protein kinase